MPECCNVIFRALDGIYLGARNICLAVNTEETKMTMFLSLVIRM
jgi:hypothetical protein